MSGGNDVKQYRMYHIAKLYYVDALRQTEIAKMLGISPMLVSRMLRKAQEQGIVTIQLQSPMKMDHDLEKRVKKKYPKIKEVCVANSLGETSIRDIIGKAGAHLVMDLIRDGSSIGVSWGQTLALFANHLEKTSCEGVQVVQICGGFFNSQHNMMPSRIIQIASDRLGATAVFMNMPMYVANVEIRDALYQDQSLRNVLEQSRKNDINVVGASMLSAESSMSQAGVTVAEDIAELRSLGAVGDLAGFFLNAKGKMVEWSKQACYIGVPFEEVIGSEYMICLCGEREKAPVIDIALRAGYIKTLVTSDQMAKALLAL